MSTFFFVDCEGHGPAAGLNDSLKFEIGVVAKIDDEQYARVKPLCDEQTWDVQKGVLTSYVIKELGSTPAEFLLGQIKAVRSVETILLNGVGTPPVACFHGVGGFKQVFESFREWLLAIEPNGRCIFVSDNPAYDWQFPNFYFHKFLGANPFGHSARRIGDFYAGLRGDFTKTQEWKKLRRTVHDHHPVHDAMGNLEAFYEIQHRQTAGSFKEAKDSLDIKQVYAACRNIGYDLSCGECAAVFFTGIGGHSHTCKAGK